MGSHWRGALKGYECVLIAPTIPKWRSQVDGCIYESELTGEIRAKKFKSHHPHINGI